MKKLLAAALLGGVSLAGHALSQPPGQNDTAKTAREMTHIVMQEHDGRQKAFVVNTLPTGGEGVPPWANIIKEQQNFLPCRGGPFALCYYSGPDGTLPCTVKNLKNQGKNVADCSCIEVPYGPYFVDINAIMDLPTYELTVEACGPSGEGCPHPNEAPVCEVINNRKLIPGADMISVFSFSCVPEQGLAQIPCDVGIYAGCMTAPCYRNPDDPEGIVRCECPLYEGCYEVGTPGGTCELGRTHVWSSAHNEQLSCPPDSSPPDCTQSTYPRPGQGATCTPDAPQGMTDACGEEIACPLFPDSGQPPVALTDEELEALRETDLCTSVCEEYRQCGTTTEPSSPQPAYTCDAVLCTSRCTTTGSFGDDLELTAQACSKLPSCISSPGISSIIELEETVGCSCCASQVCACGESEEQINDATQLALFELNQAQCDRGITPQCCLAGNGTLCGEKNGVSFQAFCGSCPSNP